MQLIPLLPNGSWVFSSGPSMYSLLPQQWKKQTVPVSNSLKLTSASLLAEIARDTLNVRLSAEGRQKVKSILAAKGITMVAFGVVVPGSEQEWKTNTSRLAKDLGVQYITSEPKKEHLHIADSLAGAYNIPIAIRMIILTSMPMRILIP